MNDFFAQLLEIGKLFNNVFSLELLEKGIYTNLGYLIIGIPLLLMLVFYLLWRFPFGRWYHWMIWWLLGGALVSIFSFQILKAELVTYWFNKQEYPEIKGFVSNLVIACGAYALIAGFLFSMILKLFAKPQSHLPFTLKRK